jgi:hypothetical protein
MEPLRWLSHLHSVGSRHLWAGKDRPDQHLPTTLLSPSRLDRWYRPTQGIGGTGIRTVRVWVPGGKVLIGY